MSDDTNEIDWSKISKPCPRCGATLVVRQNHSNGSRFLGCVNWPLSCAHTEEIPLYVMLKAQGAQTLPGFE